MSMIKVLVVEDETLVALHIKGCLKGFDCIVIGTAISGEEAIQKAKEMNPDVVLMDIILKGEIDGIEAAKQIQEELGIPIIYLTAYSDNKTVQRAKLTKPIGYILKPFQERDLKKGIETALQHR